MIEVVYILVGVLTGALIAYLLQQSRVKTAFQSGRAEIEKDYAAIEERIRSRENEINELKNEHSALKTRLAEAETVVGDLTTKKAVLEQDNQRICVLQEKLSEKEKEISETQNSLNISEKEVSRLTAQGKEREEKIVAVNELSGSAAAELKDVRKMLGEKAEALATAEEKLQHMEELRAKLAVTDEKVETLMNEKASFKADISELKTHLDKERSHSEEKLQLLEESKENLKLEFKELANEILEDKSRKFVDTNRENIAGLLNPLKEQIKDFSKKVDDCYTTEAKERHTLKSEIKNLQELSSKISEDALNLTNALKGDNKTQGAWGEMILERILEVSGLTNGREYEIQDTVRNDDGKLLRPDVIIHMPDSKDVIVDSKVSLVAYERFCSANEDDVRQKAQAAHVLSVRNHIKLLSEKKYEDVKGLNTLGYVLLFIPMEGALRLALEGDEGLFMEAYNKNIMLVSPLTLLFTLRTINKIWQYEHQNRHALEIARKAETLHTKFVNFIENLEKIGKFIQNTQTAYDQAYKQLCSGRGNIVVICKSLEDMGVNAKKALPTGLVETALLSEEMEMNMCDSQKGKGIAPVQN